MQREQIYSHTALRGIAALLVVFYHFGFGAGSHFVFESAPFFRRSYLWVDFFFMLSGFIISFTHPEFRARTRMKDIGLFLVRRFARVYPLHIVCLAYMVVFSGVTALIALHGGKPLSAEWSPLGLQHLVAQIFLLSAWGIVPDVGWNIPSWSISAEMVAYLAFPVLAIVTGSRRAAPSIILAALATAFYVVIGFRGGSLDIIQGVALLRALAGFSIGTIVCRERAALAAIGSGWLTLLQIGSVIWIVAVLSFASNDVFVIPAFAILIGSTWADKGQLPRLLSTRLPIWLGEISYSVYLIHVLVIETLNYGWTRIVVRLHIPLVIDRSVFLAAATVAILLLANLTYRYIEKPGRRWLVSRVTRRVQPSA